MLDLKAKSNTLKLTPTENRLLGLSLGKAVANFYKDENNLKEFRKQEENLKKEVKEFETKRSARRKAQEG